jgi:PAS domain S-box-containing protein
MSHSPLVVIIVATTLAVAAADFLTSAELVGGILFALPLALCALQPSMRLLWGTAAAAGLVTVAAGFWGIGRVELAGSWTALANRGFMAASLLTLTTFIYLWNKKTQRALMDTAAIARHRGALAAKNKELDSLVNAATHDSGVRKQAQQHLARVEDQHRTTEVALRESEQDYRTLLDSVEDYAIFMMDPHGVVVNWNASAQRIKGYTAAEIIGQNYSRFFPPEDIARGKPEQVLRLAAASGRHKELGMRVRKDGSRFMASQVFTALLDPAGKLRGFAEFSHDLSESKESGAKYRGLMEAAPDAMVVVNEQGHIVLLNQQTEKQFGYRADELLAQPVKTIIPEGFAERLQADGLRSAAEALAQQIGTGIELTGKRKDGTQFPIEIMLSPLKSPEGVLVTAAIRDISVRNAAREHLLQMTRELSLKHRLLDSVFEGTTDPIYVRDLEDRFTLANSACAKLFGLSANEIAGKSIRELLPNDTYLAVVRSDAEIVRGGATRTVEEIAEIDGVTRIFLITKGPYRDADRKTIGTIGIARDITSRRRQDEARIEELKHDLAVRKEADRHLAQMEGRYRGLLEAAPDAIVVVDPAGKIILLNLQAEKQFGYSRDELVGQWVSNIIPQGFAERLVADGARSAAEALAQQIGTGIELIGRRKNGSEFPIEIMLSPLQSPEGILVTAAIRDISVRKVAEEHLQKTVRELKRSNDELEHFAYVASHDLQEPLRMVASYTQLLAKRYVGRLDADADEFIGYAVDGSNRMQGLIRDLLAYSRAGANGKAPSMIYSDIALDDALANLRTAIEESGAVVTRDPLPVIASDDTQLTQVFQNLIGNAIKYRGAEAPRVHISAARSPGGEWIFAVRDNGLGIDPQYFDRIFVLFQRLHSREEFKGTGIGLAICKKMLERLGGRIWVESLPGHGSTFYFALPDIGKQS